MSVEFTNTYQEILLDNLLSIIKQNFVFQTQLKLAEKIGAEKAELQARYNEVLTKYNAIKDDAESIEQLRARAEISGSIFVEKDRIQAALNESMRSNVSLTQKLQEKETEILELKKQLKKLEKYAPTSKLKNSDTEKKKEPVETETTSIFDKVDDGSSF